MAFVTVRPFLIDSALRFASAASRRRQLIHQAPPLRSFHRHTHMSSSTSEADAAKRVEELRGPEVSMKNVIPFLSRARMFVAVGCRLFGLFDCVLENAEHLISERTLIRSCLTPFRRLACPFDFHGFERTFSPRSCRKIFLLTLYTRTTNALRFET